MKVVAVSRQDRPEETTDDFIAISDPDGAVLRAWGVNKPTVCLIRLDGYLGYRAEQGSEKLAQHLDRLLRPSSARSMPSLQRVES